MKIRLIIVVFCIFLLPSCGALKRVVKGGGGTDSQPSVETGTTAVSPPWGVGRKLPTKTGTQSAPAKASRGKVAHVDAALGFVVIDFTFSAMPAAGLRFGVFRNGLRIGEIITTKMIDEAFQVADINRGDIRMGDDVRLD